MKVKGSMCKGGVLVDPLASILRGIEGLVMWVKPRPFLPRRA